MSAVPDVRISLRNGRPVRPDGAYVLYWMTAYRRLRHNYALQRAVEHARGLNRPLLVLEDLRSGRRWDTVRHHRFILDGMAEKAARLVRLNILYYPYVEPRGGAADGLLEALAERACVVVADEYPLDVWPGLVRAAAGRLPVRLEQVDSCGLLPLLAADRTFKTAFSFRAFLQNRLRPHLDAFPAGDPLARLRLPRAAVPAAVRRRWPAASARLLAGRDVEALDLDRSVEAAPIQGGEKAAGRVLARFLDDRLGRYADRARHPDDRATSELSPYLHHGHISAHEVFAAVTDREGWSPQAMRAGRRGSKPWWGASPGAEAFLDELVTWRELGYNRCAREAEDAYASLPAWARVTLAQHARDRRPYRYGARDLESAATHDALWNAAQRQLVRDGWMHNTLRMLWGKKVLEWSAAPEESLEIMIHFNNKYSLDGRDPNSWSGVLWCLGLYDRPWGPERPVFGKVRYMSSAATARKVRLRAYLQRYAPERA
jgi:deoxyribodipyrimidine photo-lyase